MDSQISIHVEDCCRNIQGFAFELKQHLVGWIDAEYVVKTSPFYLYKPKLIQDGNQWCALLGENLQVGITGFGDTPNDAIEDFNKAFDKKAEVKVNGK